MVGRAGNHSAWTTPMSSINTHPNANDPAALTTRPSRITPMMAMTRTPFHCGPSTVEHRTRVATGTATVMRSVALVGGGTNRDGYVSWEPLSDTEHSSKTD